MAIIKCPECKKEISSEAKVCPNCGKSLKTPWYKSWVFWAVTGAIIFIAIMISIVIIQMNKGAELARHSESYRFSQETIESSVQSDSEDSTTQTEPPFFKKEYQIDDNNSMILMAGHTDNGILVNVYCQFDGSNENYSSALYVAIYARCIILSKKASVFLIVTDTATGEICYQTFADDSSSGSDPKFYNPEADIYDTNLENWYDEVDDLFQKLEAAIDENN